ncbi:adenylate/guanylate cyclase domain-containing protein [Rhizobium sp. CF142]|uniref:adenylate/guanylate cyclase domain-containing protein n=1 Tax=Rhizobium sp. CF142 TaxID=1144314 RepID=UPI00026EF127|nr:adenylate/guanylate cyclase domain-containing protein [Rhizobium sp. CF142]EJJ27780.1 family 3 adenylate cyclase [Rhizobium sp. CF142]
MRPSFETTDPASEAAEGVWPIRRRRILDWLINETRGERFIDNILVEMCKRLLAAGVPVNRSSLHFRTNHPQWIGARILWVEGMEEAKINTFAYGVETTPQFLNSPVNEIHKGTNEVRKNLEDLWEGDDYPFYQELRDDGYSEYIAWPIDHTFDKRHVVTFSTNRPGGFTGEHVDFLRDLLPALTLVSEIRLKNIMARTLLQTYVGPHASEQILSGVITRGSGTTVGAAIMICDLRDFTAISDLWPRDDVIQLLNDYFDAMSDPIERHGGEILKFMGDGLLAIFPLSKPSACEDLLTAIREGQEAMAKVNEQHQRLGRDPLRYGVGVHVGDVMYGNIGSSRRLDFTVIGPAVNVASRLETLTKEVKRPVLLSRAFVEMATCTEEMDNLGTFPLRGLGEPVEVFAFREKPTAGRDAA